MPAEGAGDVCTELIWILNARSGPVCAKGMISLSGVCALSRIDAVPFGEGDIGTMCLHLSMKPGEYSYFSPRTLSMWAGPEHWRFKPRHKCMYVFRDSGSYAADAATARSRLPLEMGGLSVIK